jgi:hypothetical protein
MIELDDGAADYMTVREVAARYRLSLAAAYSLAGALPHTLRIGRAIRVYVGDLRILEGRDEVAEQDRQAN